MKAKINQLPLQFGNTQYMVFKPDFINGQNEFAIPQYLIEQLKEERKELIVYNEWTDEIQLLNVFESVMDSTVMSKRDYKSYQRGYYRFFHHKFKANFSDKEKAGSEPLTSTERKLLQRFHWTWYNMMKDTIESNILRGITKEVRERREAGEAIFPSQENTFRAFRIDADAVRVVMLGQDPYPHNSANGLMFSSSDMTASLEKIQGGLRNQFERPTGELKTDLLHWQQQGIMLLNGALTVRKGEPNSHTDLWKPFIAETIRRINLFNQPVVFLLFGARVKTNFENLIDKGRHEVICVEHPAKASYDNRDWHYSDCFNRIDEFLDNRNERKINWFGDVSK